ncbi:MAG: hypothetical protein AB7E85_07035, partial [Pseudobdellovibrionaceae bacterium]
HIGDVYWVMGRRQEARFQCNRALSNSEDDKINAEIQDKLANGYTPPKSLAQDDKGKEDKNGDASPKDKKSEDHATGIFPIRDTVPD